MSADRRIELWGGVECTVNRVGDEYRDQVRLSGHHERLDDLDRFATLGLKALRYPVLWERAAPNGEPDWTWPDARLNRLRTLDIRPIVGLVHHGSGPRHTHLLDDGFAPGLGRYASAVAARYPWVEAWTPVNEPLTTARFSALYGHWYPHATNERSFWLALLNQVDATRAAMTAVRQVNPAARLIQTDDLGRTYATAKLETQAAHDNLRRWASWDLLFGRVDVDHALFTHLDHMGLGDRVRAIADDPCPPDVVGVNHYLTSDRFLDHRLERYPEHLHGGNGREHYADTEALRASPAAPAGLGGALREVWARYRTPIALTEVHNGCTREEQLRWVAQAWDMARTVAFEGADIIAVTAWSLLGSHGWDTLLTAGGSYEPGVFAITSGLPEETALAKLWRGLPHDAPRHPVAQERGWWQRPERLIYDHALIEDVAKPCSRRTLLIFGAGNAADRLLADACIARGITHVVADRAIIDAVDLGAVMACLQAINPWAVCVLLDHPSGHGGDATDVKKRLSEDAVAALVKTCSTNTIGYLQLCCEEGGTPPTSLAIHQAINALIDRT